MQLQAKPKYYADFNKHMDETYYNYEAYDIEYGYFKAYPAILTNMRSLPRSAKANILKFTWVLQLWMIKMLSSRS